MHHDKNHPRARRPAGVLAVTVGIALLTAACGGSTSTSAGGSSSTGASTAHQEELAFAQCMRTHGVPNFPDPDSNGFFGITGGINIHSPQVQAAQTACRHLLPANYFQPPSHAQQQQDARQALKFAQCIRSHGVPGFPDPDSSGLLQVSPGMDRLPQYQTAYQACRSLLPTHVPLKGVAPGGGS
jgi:hypothetical protein